ncbi:MAG: DUF1624 domain-containing protein [Gemmatimonadaceae bacterium]|nr:DUF1624 domain-containing protein [Gemmatimonadaceae bacterium]
MSTPSALPVPTNRLVGIDWLRGLVMAVMMLDHVRDFVHSGGFFADTLNPESTTFALYFTRWITHLCAPAFVLLAGVAAGLQMQRAGNDATARASVARFLVTRGLWLIVLELVVVQWLIAFTFDRSQAANLQVIWAIGVSMVALAALCRLPSRVVLLIGLVIIAGHNLLDGIRIPGDGGPPPQMLWWHLPWALLHQQAFLPLETIAGAFPGAFVWVSYPVLPWIGVMCAGFGAAELYAWPRERRAMWLLRTAGALLVLFVVLRLTQWYGDPLPWKSWPTITQTVMDLFDVQKYPPSLQFLAITLPPSLLALAWAERTDARGRLVHDTWAGQFHGALVTLGRVPLFFYLCQWLLAHLMGIAVSAAQGFDLAPYFMNGEQLFQLVQRQGPPRIGGPLWLAYICWLGGLLLLWPICRWYAEFKTRRTDLRWLRFL